MPFIYLNVVKVTMSIVLYQLHPKLSITNCQVSEGDHRQKIIRTFSENKKPAMEGRAVGTIPIIETIGSDQEKISAVIFKHQSKSY